MSRRLLLCTDMDRTVIPNGSQPEQPGARDRLRSLCAQAGVELVYVTGRDIGLVHQAIAEFDLPQPVYAIADVGTQIHAIDSRACHDVSAAWQAVLGSEWGGLDRASMIRRIDPDNQWRLQEESRQSRFKVSFYTPADEKLGETVQHQMDAAGWPAQAIWSVDEESGTGLLDVLPRSADKCRAIRFLQQHLQYAVEEIVFAGDSGNDLQVLISEVPAVLVGNASEAIRAEAVRRARQAGQAHTLYCANACYADGVIEGVEHYCGKEFRQP